LPICKKTIRGGRKEGVHTIAGSLIFVKVKHGKTSNESRLLYDEQWLLNNKNEKKEPE